MNTYATPADPEVPWTGSKITVLYDNRATGIRAKRFIDRLQDAMPGEFEGRPGFWRLELLEFPFVAGEAWREGVSSSVLAVSLRGDRILPNCARRFIEEWTARITGMPATLIVLFDPSSTQLRISASLRAYFRSLAEETGVGYYSLRTYSSGDEEGEAFPSDAALSCLRSVASPAEQQSGSVLDAPASRGNEAIAAFGELESVAVFALATLRSV